MPASDCRQWIDELWPLVCARAMRPLHGVLLDRQSSAGVAGAVFADFLREFPRRPGSWESAHHWLTSHVRPMALQLVAGERRRRGDWQAFRDPSGTAWEKNPDFDALRLRSPAGALQSREWDFVAPILLRISQPPLLRLGLGGEDAGDIQMETLAELTRAVTTAGPLEKMSVFEELPRFFTTMIERRAISWLRKLTAQKRRPANPAYAERLDDPENSVARQLTDPHSAMPGTPWVNAGFDRIRKACSATLSEFEWHLVEAVFVEATHSRGDLANDPWIIEQMGADAASSESTRRRKLNLLLDDALARLGHALREADL